MVMVEAVALGEELGIAEGRVHLQAGQPPLHEEGRCTLLGPDDLCAAYASRPLICRTHGLPLSYPDAEKVVYCEKNFISDTPHSSAVFDAESTETALFAANLDYCRQAGLNPMARVAIDRLTALVEASKK